MQIQWMTLAAGLVALAVVPARANDTAWRELETTARELKTVEADWRLHGTALDACREGSQNAAVVAARKALAEAEQAVPAAQEAAGLKELHDKMQQARQARDAKVESLLTDAPTYQAARQRQKELQAKIAAQLAKVDSLKAADLLELARWQQEEGDLSKRLNGAVRAWWLRSEVAKEYAAADVEYKAYGEKAGKAEALQQANEKVKAARKALADAVAAVELTSPGAKELLAKRAELEAKAAELKTKVAELEKPLLAGKTHTITVKVFDKKAKAEMDKKLTLWLPATDYIRGVILAHPMISGLASAGPIRQVAAREGLGMMVYDNFSYDIKESLRRIDAMLEQFAAETKHPELRGAPLVLGGLSASVLATRNVACLFPERVFGIVHVAGGNMQEMPDDGRGMVEVPFLAHNGEFEWCGPAGGGHSSGKAGIRGEYGNQTQWVMIREQMLRLWRDKHQHRMSLVVIPNADHGAWNQELTALFIRKAAQYRLPKEKRDGSTPAVCAPLPVNKGWLTDADLDHPQFEPAAYTDYKGDKNNAFWHFDEEMARAVDEFHKGRFILPDPTKKHPVPADWPAKNK